MVKCPRPDDGLSKGGHHASAFCTHTYDLLHLGCVGRYFRGASRDGLYGYFDSSHYRISDPACWLSGTPRRCNVQRGVETLRLCVNPLSRQQCCASSCANPRLALTEPCLPVLITHSLRIAAGCGTSLPPGCNPPKRSVNASILKRKRPQAGPLSYIRLLLHSGYGANVSIRDNR